MEEVFHGSSCLRFDHARRCSCICINHRARRNWPRASRRRPGSAKDRRRPRAGCTANDQGGTASFRYDTFGDEEFWGDALQLHRAIAGEKLGGVGPGVSPKTALAVGLKVDAEALPQELVQKIERNQVDLDDPATTMALLKLDAVVGVKGFVEKDEQLRSVGITCAICHSTVDDSFSRGIGKRLDGWPNRDLNVGKIITLAPNLKPFTDRLGIGERGAQGSPARLGTREVRR